MVWVFLILVALLIPILAIVIDSPVARSWARRLERREGLTGRDQELLERLDQLEDEVEGLNRALETNREDVQFLSRLLQQPDQRSALPSGADDAADEASPAAEADPPDRA